MIGGRTISINVNNIIITAAAAALARDGKMTGLNIGDQGVRWRGYKVTGKPLMLTSW